MGTCPEVTCSQTKAVEPDKRMGICPDVCLGFTVNSLKSLNGFHYQELMNCVSTQSWEKIRGQFRTFLTCSKFEKSMTRVPVEDNCIT